MISSEIEARRRVVDRLNKVLNRNAFNSLPPHSCKSCVASLCIKNETNLIGGENIGGANYPFNGVAPSVSGDKEGNVEGDSEPDSRTPQKLAPKTTQSLRKELPHEGFVRLNQILAVVPVSKSSWWAGCKTGRFPKPIKFGPRTTVWRVNDIRSLIESAGA